MAPYFKRVEGCTFKVNKDVRGTNGPLKLTKPKSSHFSDIIFEAAKDLGYKITELVIYHLGVFALVKNEVMFQRCEQWINGGLRED